MNPIKIFGFAGSTYVRTARLVCLEKGVAHELVPLAFRTESHGARHPFLKMPAMEHDGVHLFETLAIAAYVDGLNATPPLSPRELPERARSMQWVSAAIDYLYRDLVAALLSDVAPEGHTDRVARALDVLDGALSSRSFLAGNQLSLADLFVAPMVDFASAKVDLSGRKELTRWLTSMRARSSFQSTAS